MHKKRPKILYVRKKIKQLSIIKTIPECLTVIISQMKT